MNKLGNMSDQAAMADQELERMSILLNLLTEDGGRSMFDARQHNMIDFWLTDLVDQARDHLRQLHDQIAIAVNEGGDHE